MRDCPGVDSMGLGACISIMKQLGREGGQITLAYANERIERTFQLAKLTAVFGFHGSLQEGLAALSTATTQA